MGSPSISNSAPNGNGLHFVPDEEQGFDVPGQGLGVAVDEEQIQDVEEEEDNGEEEDDDIEQGKISLARDNKLC